MKVSEIREKYLEFFKSKNHKIIKSYSLLPENDPTTLFISSGMQPMLQYFLGEKHPLGQRITDSQKCFRTQDIEDIGDNRHSTFFEMLGNWSFGDYFKKEQLTWVFEFITEVLKLDPKRIYVTAFKGRQDLNIPKDIETVEIWKELFAKKGIIAEVVEDAEEKGMQNGRIFYYDEKYNWWSRAGIPENMPIGEPGGPDSEIFWDLGEEYNIHQNSEYKDRPCHLNCDCGRFIEIGNSVFLEYIKSKDSGFTFLPQKNVDFGGGLERMAMAVNNKIDLYELDIFDAARDSLEKLSNYEFVKADKDIKHSFRVILDHIRAATFLISDGAVPSNKDQGYFVRRLIRRAIRFANKIGIQQNFCSNIADCFIQTYKNFYSDLLDNRDFILNTVLAEEEKFLKTLKKGLKKFQEIISKHIDKEKVLNSEDVFHLFDTYGFPVELTEELAKEQGFKVNISEFNKLMEKHRQISRKGAEKKFKGGLADHSVETTKLHTATHLLHKALKIVLGESVEQKGSNITSERLRFDFNYPEKLTKEQISQIEQIVNEQISKNLPVTCKEMSVEQAEKLGAIGLFKHKYDEKVKVYFIGDFSIEICGGPHVKNTSELGKFKIIKEQASSAGIRRIKAVLE